MATLQRSTCNRVPEVLFTIVDDFDLCKYFHPGSIHGMIHSFLRGSRLSKEMVAEFRGEEMEEGREG